MRTARLLMALGLLSVGCSGETDDQAGENGGTPPAGTPAAESPAAPQGELVLETDFASPEDGLFGGEPGFRSEGPDGGYIAGDYTDHGTLALTANLPVGGGFVLGSITNTEGVFDGDRELTDLADVTIQAYANPVEWETGIVYGLRCRGQGVDSSQFYEAVVGLDDYSNEVFITRFDGPEAEAKELVREPLPSNLTIESGEYNLLRMDCIGDQISFFIDGEKVAEATDSGHAEGEVGLHTIATIPIELGDKQPGAFAVAEFDNMTVHEL